MYYNFCCSFDTTCTENLGSQVSIVQKKYTCATLVCQIVCLNFVVEEVYDGVGEVLGGALASKVLCPYFAVLENPKKIVTN